MRSACVSGWVLAVGLTAAGLAGGPASAAADAGDIPQVAEARIERQVADFTARYIQEDGPQSGNVRVELTPDSRSLSVIEARMAAEQAFLDALKEPGLGDDLKRITVVVRLMPDAHPDPDAAAQVIVYLHKGGADWSVLSGN